jgi:5-methylcytosine-specific restriction endonuclease McrA
MPEVVRLRSARYIAKHRDAILARKRERYRRNKATNPHYANTYTQARDARLEGAPGRGVSEQGWADVLHASLGICAYCNERRRLTMEHIEPLSRGGAHDIDNIAAACDSCNKSKMDKPLIAWLAYKLATKHLAKAA